MRVAAADSHAIVSAVAEGGIDYIIGVPDSGLRELTNALDRAVGIAIAPREDVAVGVAVGAYLAGRRPLVYMKNAGLGTSLDALLSLARVARVPLILLVGWAGSGADVLAHHLVMGTVTMPLLAALEIPVHTMTVADHNVGPLVAFMKQAFADRSIRVVLVQP